jgi:hypothetical protein
MHEPFATAEWIVGYTEVNDRKSPDPHRSHVAYAVALPQHPQKVDLASHRPFKIRRGNQRPTERQ